MREARHIMRMHGDYRRFYSCWDVFRQAWAVVVPMIADPVICKAFGVTNAIRIHFGCDVPEMQGGKPWECRSVHFSSPASAPFKGSEIVKAVFPILQRKGFKCEMAAWRGRDDYRNLLQDTKIMWCPSAHEGLSRACTEAVVAGCHLVVCAESDPMVEQAGLQGGTCVSTDLVFDVPRGTWDHLRSPTDIANDLAQILSRPPEIREDWSEWDVSLEIESLRNLFLQALP